MKIHPGIYDLHEYEIKGAIPIKNYQYSFMELYSVYNSTRIFRHASHFNRYIMLTIYALSLLVLLSANAVNALPAVKTNGLYIDKPVPGLAPSDQYTVRIRPAGSKIAWKNAFAWQSVCKKVDKKSDAYFENMAGWSHTYVNFETSVPVEVEISRVNGQAIKTAVVHPNRKARSCNVKNGKALVVLDKPCLVAVDIDGQMDKQDTGMGYKGPPIHTISIFANPPVIGKPKPGDPGVFTVKPGEMPPIEGNWKTLYFLPGVHNIGVGFPVHANRQYYIPGDAIVYGTFNNQKWEDGHHIRIFGLGTLSGARLKHPEYVVPAVPVNQRSHYDPIEIAGATDTSVEGVTLADSAHHSLMLVAGYAPDRPTDVRWVKIFTWRANGDGINPFGNVLVEDCFIRTQDDSLYVSGRGIRRTVVWNDYNGSAFVLSSLPGSTDRKMVVEDCDVIYSRAGWHHWTGGRVFNMRGEGAGACGAGVVFRNINIEDPRPTLQQFFICMTVPKPYTNEDNSRKAGDLSGILFQNISLTAPSVIAEPQILWGQKDARIHDLIFENLTVGGKKVLSQDFFKKNEYVDNLIFR